MPDLDLARLGLLGDRDADRQHTVVQVGFERLQIEPVTELDLASEVAAVTLGEVRLVGGPGVFGGFP